MADDQVDVEQFDEEDIIRYYFFRGFSYEEIRRFLQKYHATEISISTLKRRIKSYGLRRKQVESRVHSVKVLWKIFGVRFGLLAHNHVEFGAQVLNFGSWRMIIACSIPRHIN